MNRRQRRRIAGTVLALRAPLALLVLLAGPAAAQWPRGCDVAWPPGGEARMRLVQRDADAVLAIGTWVVARADIGASPALIHARTGEGTAATLQRRDARGERWRVHGRVDVDAACALDLDADLALEPPDAAVARAAQASATLGRALAEADAARLDAAITLAERARDELGPADTNPALAATIAAFAIERRLDDRQLGAAGQRLRAIRSALGTALDPAQPAALRLDLAEMRLLAWPDALAGRRRLAPTLDATFGPRAVPTLENRARAALALAVLGRGAESIAEFDAIEAQVANRDIDQGLRRLVARSHAMAFFALGRHDEQVARLRALREELAAQFGADDRRVVDLDIDIARGLTDAGRLPEAIVAAARGYLWRETALGFDHVRTQDAVGLLALLFSRAGRHRTARALLEDLLPRLDPAVDVDLVFRTRRDLATERAIDGDAQGGLGLMELAYADAQARFSADSPYVVGAGIDYGWLLLRAGAPQAACTVLEKVSAHLRARTEQREWLDAGLARCLLERRDATAQDVARAVDLLRTTSEAAARTAGADNARTLAWEAMRAAAELRAGRVADAKARLIAFVQAAERNRARMAAGSAVRDSTFGRWVAENDAMAGYRTLAMLHAQDGELDDALRVTELARDRQLRDRFAERRWNRLAPGLPGVAQLRDLQAQRQAIDEAIAVAGDIAQRVRLEAQRVAVTEALDRVSRPLDARLPHEADAQTPAVADLQARLAPDTALVAYQRAGERWWILVVERDRARVEWLPDGANVAPAARAWVRNLRDEPVRVWQLADDRWALAYVRPAGAVARVPLARVEAQLGAQLLGRLQPAPRVRRLVVVADDELVGLPLDALRVPGEPRPAATRYEFTYAASFDGWLALRDHAAARRWPRDLLAVGPPDAGDGIRVARPAAGTSASAATSTTSSASKSTAAPPSTLRGSYAPLPFAREEIARIARGFAPARVRVLLERDASKAALIAASRSGDLARYRYVHFATHALVDPAFAERAALVLGAPGGEVELNATEFAGLVMNAELVVLSACDSGVGRFEQGQGLLGFAFAALAAGNRGAVLSLWPVADATTAAFMDAFYARLRGGLAPAAALAATKREFLRSKDPRRADPRVWAAFVLYGGS